MLNKNFPNTNIQSSGMDLNDFINSNNNVSFHSYLMDLLYKKNIQNSLVYKQANLTKQYFSKLISGTVIPSKIKLLQLSVGLRLNIVETTDLLAAAGYSLTKSSVTDLIFQYFISNGDYDIYKIDIAIYDYKLKSIFD